MSAVTEAPPYITLKNPDTGIGLRTRSVESARKRLDALFTTCAVDVTLDVVQLSILGSETEPVLAEALAQFGPPTSPSGEQGFQDWRWRVEGDATVEALDRWFPHLRKHQKVMATSYRTQAWISATWTFRLRPPGREPAGPPYPRSQIQAQLAGKGASAYFDLVFPYEEATPELVADWRAVGEAMGLELPTAKARLATRKKDGTLRLSSVDFP